MGNLTPCRTAKAAPFPYSQTAAVAPALSSSVAEEAKKEEKEFTLTNLEAVDLANTSRTAKAGKTLYYISNKSTKNTKFEITINPKLPTAEIEKDRIQWTYNTAHLAEGDGKIKVEKSIVENDNAEVSVKAGVPSTDEKNVKVEWVNNYTKQVDVVSPGVKNALNALSNYVNNLGGVLKKLDNTGKLEFNISFQGQEYVEEDKATRFYNTVRDGGFNGSIDFVFNGFTYGVNLKVATAQLYLRPILSVSANGSMQFIKRNDQKEFTKLGSTMAFNLNADLEAGGAIGFDVGIITLNANPYAGISSGSTIKYFSNTNSINCNVVIGKPFVGIRGEVLLKGYNILPSGDFKYTWENIAIELSQDINLGK